MDKIIELTLQHIGLTATAIAFAILIGVPLGILITRVKPLAKYVLGFVNIVQAIPSMALLGLLVPVLGIGSKPAIFAVVTYSLLPIVKNTYIGLSNIDPVVLESAKGMGLTGNQILFKIKLPLALPVIMGGVRISSVTAVGLMTLASFIGAGGLGYLVFSGVQTVNNTMILQGAIPACILALLVDFVFSKIEIAVTPKGISTPKAPKKNTRALKVIGAVVIIIVLVTGASMLGGSKKDTITIGSKNYTEQLIMGNIFADLVEEYTDYDVERKLNLGGTMVAFNALKDNELDMYVDFTGTILMNILEEDIITDRQECYDISKSQMKELYNIVVLDELGYNNTYTLSMMPDVAEQYNITKISDLEDYADEFIVSPTIEFENRDDGLIGLEQEYGFKFETVKAMDGSLRYTALANGEAQVIDAFSTEGLIKKFNLTVLEDDKNFFPPYYAVPMVHADTLEKYPELEDVFNMLAGQLDEETVINLNYKVDELGESPEDVSREFLIERGLITP